MAGCEAAADPAKLVKRLTEEGLVNPAAIGRKLGSPRGGRAVHPSCVTRWCQAGIPTAGGGHIRLEAIKVGTRWASSWPAVLQFLTAQQQPFADLAPPVRTPSARSKAAAAAEMVLVELGC